MLKYKGGTGKPDNTPNPGGDISDTDSISYNIGDTINVASAYSPSKSSGCELVNDTTYGNVIKINSNDSYIAINLELSEAISGKVVKVTFNRGSYNGSITAYLDEMDENHRIETLYGGTNTWETKSVTGANYRDTLKVTGKHTLYIKTTQSGTMISGIQFE